MRVPVLSLSLVLGSACCCCCGVSVGVGVGVGGQETDWSCIANKACFNGFVFLSHRCDHLGGLFFFFNVFSVKNDIVSVFVCWWRQ